MVLRMRGIMFCLSAFIDRKLSQFPTNKCRSSSEQDFSKVQESLQIRFSSERTTSNMCFLDLSISVVFLFSLTFHVAYTLTITKGSFLGKWMEKHSHCGIKLFPNFSYLGKMSIFNLQSWKGIIR